MNQREAVQQLAEQYIATGNVAAVMLAGSHGRGRADEYSDVELDVYWAKPPSSDQRNEPTLRLQGDVRQLWPYDVDDAEWSEDVRVFGIDVTVSGFATEEISYWIETLATWNRPYLHRQMRLSAIQDGKSLYGEQMTGKWRASTIYPEQLAICTAGSFLAADQLNRWRHWSALVQRDDTVMLQQACSDVTRVLLGVLCALNRIFIEHPSFKWVRCLVPRFGRAPDNFHERFFQAVMASPARGAPELHALLVETVEIATTDLPGLDVANISNILNCQR